MYTLLFFLSYETLCLYSAFFFFNDTATTEIYTLSLHDALPIFPLEGDRDFGELCGSHQGCQVPFRPPFPNVGLLLRRCSGKGLHLAMTREPPGFSRVTAGFSSYDGEFRLPLVLAQASPIFHSSCEGKLGIALE